MTLAGCPSGGGGTATPDGDAEGDADATETAASGGDGGTPTGGAGAQALDYARNVSIPVGTVMTGLVQASDDTEFRRPE